MVAAYSWRSHVLRVHITFANGATLLEIGECSRLRQTATRIHKRAKALEMELVEGIRRTYAANAIGRNASGAIASQSAGSKKPSYCISMWEGDPHEQASCLRAQRRSYDRLRPLISQLNANPSTLESRRLKDCYSATQTWAGTDWEAAERCFYSAPAFAQ
jgi:hypothetical protein